MIDLQNDTGLDCTSKLCNAVLFLCVGILSLATLLAVVYALGGWGFVNPSHAPDHYLLPTLTHVAPCMLVVVVAAIVLAGVSLSLPVSAKVCLAAVGVFAISLRLVIVFAYCDQLLPFSDFARVWDIASGGAESVDYYRLFPTYLNWAALERVIMQLGGGTHTFLR